MHTHTRAFDSPNTCFRSFAAAIHQPKTRETGSTHNTQNNKSVIYIWQNELVIYMDGAVLRLHLDPGRYTTMTKETSF